MQTTPDKRSLTLTLLVLFQLVCLGFFLTDVVEDMGGSGWAGLWNAHMLPELAAIAGMMLGLAFQGRYLMNLLRRQSHLERGLGVAAGQLALLMEDYFRQWKLTASEQDVATFTIKGYTIAEIAELRGSAEATVKTHLNAIYRKSGVSGRGQLVSILIEDLMRAPLVADAAPISERSAA